MRQVQITPAAFVVNGVPQSGDSTMLRLMPTADKPEPLPSWGGNWRRDADGAMAPLDAASAAAAGLQWGGAPPPESDPEPEPDPE